MSWEEHLPKLFEMKAAGKLRYVGITTSHGRRHEDLEKIMASQKIDFVQLSYNAVDREVEQRLLPLAQERKIAVICNRPFQQGDLIRAIQRAPLPSWAAEIDCTNWAQVLLKFVVSHPAVTCAIPATSNPAHMREDMGASYGRMPDPAMRTRIADTRPEFLMSEWWTYTLHDLILFSSRAYHRLFELYNAAIWPAQIAALGLGVAIARRSRGGAAAASGGGSRRSSRHAGSGSRSPFTPPATPRSTPRPPPSRGSSGSRRRFSSGWASSGDA